MYSTILIRQCSTLERDEHNYIRILTNQMMVVVHEGIIKMCQKLRLGRLPKSTSASTLYILEPTKDSHKMPHVRTTYSLELHDTQSFIIDVIYQVKLLMLHNVQTTNLTFVGNI